MSKPQMTEVMLVEFQHQVYELVETVSLTKQVPYAEVMISLLTIGLVATKRGFGPDFKAFITKQLDIVETSFNNFQESMATAQHPEPEPLDSTEYKKI